MMGGGVKEQGSWVRLSSFSEAIPFEEIRALMSGQTATKREKYGQ